MGFNQLDEEEVIGRQQEDKNSAYWNFIAACDFIASHIVHDTLNSLTTSDVELRSILASPNVGSLDLKTSSIDLRSSLESALGGIQAAQAILGRFRASTRLHHSQPQLVDFRKSANRAIADAARVLSVSVSPLDLQKSMPIWVEMDEVAFQSLSFLWMRLIRLTYLDSFHLAMELRKIDPEQNGFELCLATDVPLSRIRAEWLTAMPMSDELTPYIDPPYHRFSIYIASMLHRIRATLKTHAGPANRLELSVYFAGNAQLATLLKDEETIPSVPVRNYVLVVESNEYVRNSLVASLQAMGYGAIEATNLIEARQITESFPFTFIGKVIDEQTTERSLQECFRECPDWFRDGIVLWTSPRVRAQDLCFPTGNCPKQNAEVKVVEKPYSLEHLLKYFVQRS